MAAMMGTCYHPEFCNFGDFSDGSAMFIDIYVYICMYVHTGCPGGNVPDFGRMFLKLKYTDLTKNTYIRS